MKIHLDLDSYFVSAECKRYPFLKGKNVVVAKSSDRKIFATKPKEGVLFEDTGAFNSLLEFRNPKRENILNAWQEEFIEDGKVHGIVIAKSYEAKRYNIKTGTPLKEALGLCPNLIVIPSDHMFYQEISQELKAYLESKIPLLEQYSIDEFFGDLNGWINEKDTLDFITTLQKDIKSKFDLPISIGASRSKWIAKLLTDRIKPYGVKVLKAHEVLSYTKDIPIEEFPGIGKRSAQKLHAQGIKTLGELRRSPSLLESYGKRGKELYQKISGRDNEAVNPNHERKGVGISRNFKPILDRVELYRRVTILARYLSHTIFKLELNPATFYFRIKYDFGHSQKISHTHYRLFNERFLIDLALDTIRQLDRYPSYKVSKITMSASNFITPSNPKTFSLLEYEQDQKMATLNKELFKLREKYGVDTIRYGNETMVKL
ncbi:MAG: DNA polymerase IV [Campylobacterota bacterium]|nr:DNA polymerase IV [Campylobacterota bacterium]